MNQYSKQLLTLKREIYNALYFPVSQLINDSSLYIRGSLLDQGSTFKPWDIDVTLIVQEDEVEIAQFISKASSRLKLNYLGDLHTLDLSCTSPDRLRNGQHIILNIMLHQQSSLIWGDDIVSKVPVFYPDFTKIMEMRSYMESIIKGKVEIVEKGLKENMGSNEIYLRMRFIIKHLIRWHCLESLLEKKLLRRLESCLEWIRTTKSFSLANECRSLLHLVDYHNFMSSDAFWLVHTIKNHILTYGVNLNESNN